MTTISDRTITKSTEESEEDNYIHYLHFGEPFNDWLDDTSLPEGSASREEIMKMEEELETV